ncbi:MAG: hypothetical protein ACXVLT_06655 [Flavisolibacter sp.]
MKYICLLLLSANLFFACTNSSKTSASGDTSSATPTNVQNVNGNEPDTTSGMTLNKPLPVDSSRLKDSAKH